MKKTKTKQSKQGKKLLNNILPMLLRSTVIFVVTIAICALICYLTNVEYDKYYLFLIFGSAISSFIAGFINSRKNGKNGIINGLTAALPIALLIFSVSLTVTNAEVSFLLPITVICVVLSGAVAGTFGVNIGR